MGGIHVSSVKEALAQAAVRTETQKDTHKNTETTSVRKQIENKCKVGVYTVPSGMNDSLYGSARPKISSSPNYKTENDIRWTTEKKEIMDWAQQQTGRKLGKVSETYFCYVSGAFCSRNAD